MTRIGLLLLILLAQGVFIVRSAPAIPTSIQASIRQRVDYGYNAGIVAGAADASGRAYFSYGSGSLESIQELDERTLFEIGSVTKVFTGTLLARMIQTGEADLTNRVRDYLPAVTPFP